MSSETANLDAVQDRLSGQTGRAYWRSLDELAESGEVRELLEREFPSQKARFADRVQRRDFLRLMGASLALAGVGACTRQPPETIVPFANRPESDPGTPMQFATAMTLGGSATGLLVESHAGRPTKVEGNPEHPSSLGATDGFAQAAIHTLYDPERSKTVVRAGEISSWDRFLEELKAELGNHADGAGIAILTEPIASPTLGDQLDAFLKKFPKARWHAWTPLHRDNEAAGAAMAFGRDVAAVHAFDKAKVVVSLDSDFLASGPAAVRYARDFMAARRGRAGTQAFNRLYAVESSPTLTGAMADHRQAVKPSEVEAIAEQLAGSGGSKAVQAARKDLEANKGASLVVAGPWATPRTHALVHQINASLGNVGKTVRYIPPVARTAGPCAASITQLVNDMNAGKVTVLLMLGGNPVYDAPASLDFGGALKKVAWRTHLSLYDDETSGLCQWHVPEAHFLEAWGDARGHDGTQGVQQPLIAPLYGGKTAIEVLGVAAGDAGATAHKLVEARWKRVSRLDGKAFTRYWQTTLHDGVARNSGSKPVSVTAKQAPAGVKKVLGGVEVAFRPDASAYDGRFANNGWLQETPRPLTRLTWDNAALLAPATAKRLDVGNNDVVELSVEGAGKVSAPVWVTPGHPAEVVTLHLGYGRSRVGSVGDGVGTNAYALRADGGWAAGVTVRKTGDSYRLVSVQDHASMEGRDIVRQGEIEAFRKDPEHATLRAGHHAPEGDLSLHSPWKYDGNAWGMVIDLNACTGCNACMVACQSENNVPVVGKQEVDMGREMHWIRVDRYYEGDADAPRAVHQPVPCMHCENAPCEIVCPVAATVHSDEGLNDMVYNRCVGTRYCANNCPYKVRRFNFFSYTDYDTEVKKLGNNPDVTIRVRGVMEKCTYCVQRINHARIQSKKADQPIADGTVVSACQQVCPTGAIVFGNINDKTSDVAKLRAEPHHYALLGELGTKPRTTYLARLTNPNPELA
ncbi:MAG: TAT-variant-translocated molybdopterin oxidoreductase [Planctomycetota bacterium]|jgi:molybdopterin-containing oxidoreductase family iron-sulfur binding subunit